jgi:hypothetical protein
VLARLQGRPTAEADIVKCFHLAPLRAVAASSNVAIAAAPKSGP